MELCEDHLALDLACIRRSKRWRSGQPASINLLRGGRKTTNTVTAVASPHGIRIMYRALSDDRKEWEAVAETLQYVSTPTRFGGNRTWYQCLGCGNGCRGCHGLRYKSQYQTARDRASDAPIKVLKMIGRKWTVTAKGADYFPIKPRGMHWRTYWRLKDKHDELESEYKRLLAKDLEKVLERYGLSAA